MSKHNLSWGGVPQSWLVRVYSSDVMASGYPSAVLAGGKSTPVLGYPSPGTRVSPLITRIPPPGTGVPLCLGVGTPHLLPGYPLPGRNWDQKPGKEPGTGVPPWEETWNNSPGYSTGKDMRPVVGSTMEWRLPIPEQTNTCENITSRRTTNAGGR